MGFFGVGAEAAFEVFGEEGEDGAVVGGGDVGGTGVGGDVEVAGGEVGEGFGEGGFADEVEGVGDGEFGVAGAAEDGDGVPLGDEDFGDGGPKFGRVSLHGFGGSGLEGDEAGVGLAEGGGGGDIGHEGLGGKHGVGEGVADEGEGALDFVDIVIGGGDDGWGQTEGEGVGGAGAEPFGGAGETEGEGGFAVALEIESEIELVGAEGEIGADLGGPGGGAALLFPGFAVEDVEVVDEGGDGDDGSGGALAGPDDVRVGVEVTQGGDGECGHNAITDCAEANDENTWGLHLMVKGVLCGVRHASGRASRAIVRDIDG